MLFIDDTRDLLAKRTHHRKAYAETPHMDQTARSGERRALALAERTRASIEGLECLLAGYWERSVVRRTRAVPINSSSGTVHS